MEMKYSLKRPLNLVSQPYAHEVPDSLRGVVWQLGQLDSHFGGEKMHCLLSQLSQNLGDRSLIFRKTSMTSLISKDLSDLLEAFARRSCTRR